MDADEPTVSPNESSPRARWHLAPERVADLSELFPGLAAPTVLPLAGRDDLVAVHLVVPVREFWNQLATLRRLDASGIVALPPDALLP